MRDPRQAPPAPSGGLADCGAPTARGAPPAQRSLAVLTWRGGGTRGPAPMSSPVRAAGVRSPPPGHRDEFKEALAMCASASAEVEAELGEQSRRRAKGMIVAAVLLLFVVIYMRRTLRPRSPQPRRALVTPPPEGPGGGAVQQPTSSGAAGPKSPAAPGAPAPAGGGPRPPRSPSAGGTPAGGPSADPHG
eukprot:TRINITY_DN9727_c0_g1_i1.p2 TRINITY_DN9727_c0_g1~~TRINITY_DN9727_c0_g1_i1.p2  ORF type:complete len:190 (+),score=31.41 TRINITY_DN9727_c0_g1_i1:424-993(+)